MPHPPVPDPLGNAMPWPGPGKATLRFADAGVASPLQAALAAGGAAAWHTDLQTRERWWSPEMFRIHGLGAGEAHMRGRLIVEQGDVRDLVNLLAANDRWEDARGLLNASTLTRMVEGVTHRIARVNMARRSKKNVAHHYDLSDRLYDLFLDKDRQYSCAYWTDPGHETLEQAQADK